MSLLSTGVVHLAQAGSRDTVVMIQAPLERGTLESVTLAGQFAVLLAALVLLGAILVVLLALRKSTEELTSLLKSSYKDISEAALAVRRTAEDVRVITQSVKTDVAAVSDTVRYVNKGVRRAVRRTRQRLEEMDALASVAQEEAENLVASTSSALRGFQAGAAALRRTFLFSRGNGARRKRKRPPVRTERRGYAGRERPTIRARVADDT